MYSRGSCEVLLEVRCPSLEAASVNFVDKFVLELVQRDVARLKQASQLSKFFALSESVLTEAALISLELACCGSLGQKVSVAVFELNRWLAAVVVEGIGPEGNEASRKPEVVVAADKASKATDSIPETQEGA